MYVCMYVCLDIYMRASCGRVLCGIHSMNLEEPRNDLNSRMLRCHARRSLRRETGEVGPPTADTRVCDIVIDTGAGLAREAHSPVAT